VVVLDKANDSDLILRCLRPGAAEFLYPPFSTDQLRQALARLGRRARAAIAQARSGSEVCSLACNPAFQLEELKVQMVLLRDLGP
jgi:response regulator of citrate/malate metabolism